MGVEASWMFQRAKLTQFVVTWVMFWVLTASNGDGFGCLLNVTVYLFDQKPSFEYRECIFFISWIQRYALWPTGQFSGRILLVLGQDVSLFLV
jgi:hypothetical protein